MTKDDLIDVMARLKIEQPKVQPAGIALSPAGEACLRKLFPPVISIWSPPSPFYGMPTHIVWDQQSPWLIIWSPSEWAELVKANP